MACGELNGMQESNVCLFCDIWRPVMYSKSFVHEQDGRTPLLVASWYGRIDIAQLLVEKGANIEVTEKV